MSAADRLSEAQKRYLRGLAHGRKAIVQLGSSGVTEPVIAELDQALRRHELVKIRIRGTDRDSRDAMIEALCRASGGELVQRIGHVAVLYRRDSDAPRIMLPD